VVSSVLVETYQSDCPPHESFCLAHPTTLWCCCSGMRIWSAVRCPMGPGFESRSRQFFSFFFGILAIPRQSTKTRNILQASVGRTYDRRQGLAQAGKDTDKRTRGRAVVPSSIEYLRLLIMNLCKNPAPQVPIICKGFCTAMDRAQ
jgi:hypothetical protein